MNCQTQFLSEIMRRKIVLFAMWFLSCSFTFGQSEDLTKEDTVQILRLLDKQLLPQDRKDIPKWVYRMERAANGGIRQVYCAIEDSVADWDLIRYQMIGSLFLCGYADKDEGIIVSITAGGGVDMQCYFSKGRTLITIGTPIPLSNKIEDIAICPTIAELRGMFLGKNEYRKVFKASR
jgi:hypothetical protein